MQEINNQSRGYSCTGHILFTGSRQKCPGTGLCSEVSQFKYTLLMPTARVLSKDTHTSLAENAGRPQDVSGIIFPVFCCIGLKAFVVRSRALVDINVDDHPKE